jgi:hypothetical protein
MTWLEFPEPMTRQDAGVVTDLVADLTRRYDPGGYRLTCPVAGCRWVLDVPRLELDPEPLDVDVQDRSYTIYAEGVPREELEQTLAAHLDRHATDGAPPPILPPTWEEQEWCDGGTCEHPECLESASVEAAWREEREP